MTGRMHHNLAEQREDWLEMPVLYIKYKQEEKWHGNYINMLKRKKEKERKIAGKRNLVSKKICLKGQNDTPWKCFEIQHFKNI